MITTLLPVEELPQAARDAAMLATARQVQSRFLLARLSGREALAHSGFHAQAMAGDRARDGRRWQEGFACYRAALDIFPHAAGYMVQAGHCLQEAGRMAEAEGYYRSALLLGAPAMDVVEHLVFVAGRNRHPESAARLEGLAQAVAAEAPYIAETASMDEIFALARFWGLDEAAVLGTALDCLREGTPHPAMSARILALGPAPAWLGLPPAMPASAAPPAAGWLGRLFGRRRALRPPSLTEAPMAAASIPQQQQQPPPPPPPTEPPPTDWPALFAEEAAALAPGGAGLAFSAVFGAPVTPGDSAAAPVLSIIIVGGDAPEMAWLSAASAFAAVGVHELEVIVVQDEASVPSGTISVPLPEGAGWAEACTAGAAVARGATLLFLQAGAALGVGAPDALLNALEIDPDTGLAGPVQLLPDGTLLEAGRFIRPDGSLSRRGDGGLPLGQLPPQDIVDALGPEALMLRTADFAALGGFDAALQDHGPALLVADLALRLRARGRYTVLVPAVHSYQSSRGVLPDAAAAAALHSRWGSSLGSRAAAPFVTGL